MKTIPGNFKLLLLTLLISFAFTSCSSDDDTPQEDPKQDLIIGTWIFDSTETEFPATECEKNSYLEFNNNGTAFGTLLMDSPDGACIPLMATKYNYKLVSEKTIKFTVLDDQGNEEKDNFFNSEIVSVSATKLVLKDFAFMIGNVEFKK